MGMAPALTEPVRKSNRTVETVREVHSRKRLRRALSSVDNVSTHMEDHNMGLRSAASFLKDTQEMEQILGELSGGGDLGQVDILQVIKTMEGSNDPDAMFPLGGFERDFLVDVGEVGVSDGGAAESGSIGTTLGSIEEREESQRIRLERRLAFLKRRLRMQQARAIGKRAAEIAGLAWTRAGGGLGGVRALLRRLDNAALSSNSSGIRNSIVGNLGGPNVMSGLERTAGSLRTELSVVENHLDSDATASSSGAESNDETIAYNNTYQHPLSISQRALWKWARDRAAIASKWSWLQIQIHELEYKIQQHTELHRQVRAAKGQAVFEEVGGYAGPLPGSDVIANDDITCARVRPLERSSFRKRRLLQLVGLHNAAARAARPADVRCSCAWPRAGCAVCTGRALPHRPAPTPFAALAPRARLSRVDNAFHPVLSDVMDASPGVRAAGFIRDPLWQQRVIRSSKSSRTAGSTASGSLNPSSKIKRISGNGSSHGVNTAGGVSIHSDCSSHKKKKNKSKRGRPPMGLNVSAGSRGNASRQETGDESPAEESPVPSPASRTAGRPRLNSSYDIDNIIIPHCVASNTRLEILHYKEIITPKWRVLDVPGEKVSGNNGILKRLDSEKTNLDLDSDEEDISDQRLLERHQRCEQQERGKFRVQNATGTRRHHSSHSGSSFNHLSESIDDTSVVNQENALDAEVPAYEEPNTTLDAAPAPQVQEENGSATENMQLALPTMKRRPTLPGDGIGETVRPYTPRTFPLSDEKYANMLEAMPENHPLEGTADEGGVSPAFGDRLVQFRGDGDFPDAGSDCTEEDFIAEVAHEDPDDPEWEAKPAKLDKLHHR